MIAKKELPTKYADWNAKWGAPFGRRIPILDSLLADRSDLLRLIARGPFGIQYNNDTRTWEYPWAFYATPLSPGLNALEIGGGLSGFSFTLSKHGIHTTNVDPSPDQGLLGLGEDIERKMNKLLRTDVHFIHRQFEDHDILSDSLDRVFCLSVLEHVEPPAVQRILTKVRAGLKSGGYLVLTSDLFPNVKPFTDRVTCKYGQNQDFGSLLDDPQYEIVVGNPKEVFGSREFDPKHILANLSDYYIGQYYPTLVECLVLRKL